MSGILEVFACVEAAVLVVGLLCVIFMQEIAKLVGLAVWTYGTLVVVVLFLLTTFAHDHIHLGVH
ncbi:MAG: hypothetical protein EPO08_21375 [Rhodospirillaceae bacterium]|nr:MAG: hypothetical protein EPO08_21375 [Rhodospirillaceae bacterium]